MPKQNPRVSIGLPVHNGESFLQDALESLLTQTYTDFELVVCDNASSDGTERICRDYASRDSRIRYYRNDRNYGAIWNQNRVFELSTGELFKWAAHDDMCAPALVERCVEVLDRMPSVVLCYSETVMIDEHGTQVGQYLDKRRTGAAAAHERFKDLLLNYGLSNPMYGLIRSTALRQTPLLGNYFASDTVLLAELALIGQFWKVPEPLFFRRDHPQKSYRANATTQQLAAWYGLQDAAGAELFYWRLFGGYMGALRRTPASVFQRARCCVHMFRWLRWKIKPIEAELVWRFKNRSHSTAGPPPR